MTMGRRLLLATLLLAPLAFSAPAKRIVILKIDGLNADLLEQTMAEIDGETGKSKLPWLTRIFAEHGTIFNNFYSRGISLSAPSWGLLDTGRHSVVRGNVEYDRYTGRVYDYLNFFPFYVDYARSKEVDMPAVGVLDRAGIPLLIDSFRYRQQYQSFQLYQRGVRFTTLNAVLGRRLRAQLLAPMETGETAPLSTLLNEQTEAELKAAAANPEVLYLDYYTGDIDHEGHATTNQTALLLILQELDRLAGRIWTAIQSGPLASETVFVAVSDHGMNNRPNVLSQGFNLPDLFNSPEGGGHHVITNRHQMSDFKIMGLYPLVERVVNPSTGSSYLAGQAPTYPTAWLDLDGNERAAVQLRNNDLNRLHILLQQLARKDLPAPSRQAAAAYISKTIERHRAHWTRTVTEMDEELSALDQAVKIGKFTAKSRPHRNKSEEKSLGIDRERKRLDHDISWWQRESASYREYLKHLRALLGLQPDSTRVFTGSIEKYIPPKSLGEYNRAADLQHYVVGPSAGGLVVDSKGQLDEERSFQHVDYFPLLLSQHVRNNLQPALANQPVDFVTMRVDDGYWLYGSEDAQLLIQTDSSGRIAVQPISHMHDGHWLSGTWQPGLPLHLFEDSNLHIPNGQSRSEWLSSWHTETEWLEATHRCHYSNGVIDIVEELSPVEANVPGVPGLNPIVLRYERRRRALVQADLHIFAGDGWNFNARNVNPGGNHGGFFRISTHSVWMMAGADLPACRIEHPYDSLNFASTLLSLLGRQVPMSDRVVSLQPVSGTLGGESSGGCGAVKFLSAGASETP